MNNFYVYFHYRKSDGVLFYIGKGKNNRAFVASKRNEYWKNTVLKHGIVVKIVDNNLSEQQAFELECFCIDFLKDKSKLTNMTNGGEGFAGGSVSEENRKKTSERMKLRIVSDVTRKKLSEVNKGKKLSELHRLKLSKAKIGKYKGNLNPFADPNIYTFVRCEDNFTVKCTRQELCQKFNLTSDHVKKLFAKSPRKTSKGWRLVK